MRRVMVKGLLARKLRMALTALSVVLGVAFVAGTFVLSDTLASAFDRLFSQAAAHTDVKVRSTEKLTPADPAGPTRGPVPEALLERVRSAEGVAAAYGYVQGRATIVGKDGKLAGDPRAPSLGGSASGLGTLSPFTIKEGRAPERDDEIVIDAATARSEGFAVGDRIRVEASRTGTDTLVGIVGFGSADTVANATFVLWDMPTAQRVLHRLGEFDEIAVRADDGVSRPQLVARLQPLLPEGIEAVTSDLAAAEAADDLKQALSFIDTFLFAFAGVALFVGSFIIYNTFAIVVAQRLRELALLRVLGASRRQITRSVLAEALIVGFLASTVGVGTGVVVAAGLKRLLTAFGMNLPTQALVIETHTVIVPVVVGVLITVAASWSPARKASKVPPLAALRGAQEIPEGRTRRRRLIGGAIVVGLGLVGLAGGLTGGAGIGLVGVAALVFYAGVAMLSPLVAAPLSRVIGAPAARFRGLPGRLGRLNAMRNPRRTASTAAALMIGLGLVSFVTILAASLKTSFAATLERSMKADYIVEGPGGGRYPFSREVILRLADQPQLQVVSPIRFDGEFKLAGKTNHHDAVDPSTFGDVVDIDLRHGKLADFLPGTMLVSDRVADDEGFQVGQPVEMVFPRTGAQLIKIAGIYHDNTLFSNGYIMTLDDSADNAGNDLDNLVLARRAPGVSDQAARAAVNPILAEYPSVTLQDQAGFKERMAAQIDQLLGLVSVLLLLAVVIAVIGIINTLALSVVERTRELGLLRAVGMSRRQVRQMIRWESIIIAVLGAVLGLGVGTFFARAAATAMEDIGADHLNFPTGRLASFVLLAAAAGTFAAIFPARRATHLNILEAITHD